MQEKLYELTNPQKTIWFTEEFFKGTPIENITGTVIISEKVDFSILEKAINIFVSKNDSFRLKFTMQNKTISQYVDAYIEFPVETIDVNDENLTNVEKEISSKVFDILISYLFEFKMIKFPNGHGGFIINMHHLISDAWTAGLGASEIIKIYALLLKNENTSDITYPSYTEYINSEQDYLKSEKYNKDKAFWGEMFQEVPEVATIPNPEGSSEKNNMGAANRIEFNLSKSFINKINSYCKDLKVSAFNFFMSVYSIYIGRVSGLDKFVIGTPILNRSNVKEKHTSGMFVSTVPLKVDLSNNISFKDLITNISSNLFSIFKHQKYPYLSLLEDLRKKDSTIPNLYNILISYQNIRSTANTSETPYNIKWVPNSYVSDDMDIHIYDMNDTGNITIAYDYQMDKYSENEISNIHERILNIIDQVLVNADFQVNNVDIVTPEEKHKLLYEFNETKVDYPKDKTISMLFEEQAKKTPDNIAVVFENKEMTYKELDEKTNSLANYLRSKSIKNNDIIGIMVPRSMEMIISILAVLKSGASYIPIDPEYPQDRIEYMLSNSNSRFLLTFENLKNNINFENTIIVELSNTKLYSENKKSLININKPTDSAYIIYTSGSTGLPKGVVLTHRALSNLTNYSNNYIQYLKDSTYRTIVSITTVSFDIFIFETLISLQRGLKLVIANENEKNIPRLLNQLIRKYNITIIQSTPSRMQFLVNNFEEIPALNKLKFITLAGEQLPISLSEQLKNISGATIYNGYGPSETTVFSTLTDVSKHNVITIGRPLDNTQIYILDSTLNILPIGYTGEIYISGDGLGKGYLNNPELTNKSFVPNVFCKNSLMYKTGDLGYYKPNGEIMCLGRCDTQVKIRGLRIELGEIEACLESYPNIDKSVVLVDDNQKIIAYFSSTKELNLADLKLFLQRKLPSYFIPNQFVKIAKFKLTPNGKIDKKALRKIRPSVTSEYEPPQNEYQRKLVKMFENVLNISHISINDNFFEIGGDSLSAIKLQIETFNNGLSLSYKDIFTYPTIKLLSENISHVNNTTGNEQKEIYDYTNINKLIASNVNPNQLTIKSDNIKNILLTGSTGYLGSHILDYLLKHTRSNIYCLIRKKDNSDPQTRLLETLRFYFGNKYDKLIFKRIFVVEGDTTKSKLGLNNLYYTEFGTSIDCVINSAAIVKHYGQSSLFNDTNVLGTQNLINFCCKFNCKLIHLSTLSVSGNIFSGTSICNKQIKTFSEKDLYVEQDLSNIYVKTKFIAERLILENVLNNNLNAKIIRLGNITNRYSDGAFQLNITENAFMNRIRSFIKIGYIPMSLKNLPIEFSPVDLCAEAIVNISKYKNPYTIFHVFNNNTITFDELVKALSLFDIKIEFIEDDIFTKKVKDLSQNDDSKQIISGIINDFSDDNKIEYNTYIKLENSFTNKYLKQLLFKWPKINKKYIRQYIAYLKSINYI